MIERRRRDFDLAAILQFLMFGDHLTADGQLLLHQLLLLHFSKTFPLLIKLANERIALAPYRIKPGEIKPDLKITPILFFKVVLDSGKIFPAGGPSAFI